MNKKSLELLPENGQQFEAEYSATGMFRSMSDCYVLMCFRFRRRALALAGRFP